MEGRKSLVPRSGRGSFEETMPVTLSRRTLLATGAATLACCTALTAPAFAQGAYDMTEMLKPGPLPEMILGKADAPITVIEYASMTCIHCAKFHELVFPYLKEKYIDTGKVRLIYREFPLDPLAGAASMLIRCSPQDKYFDLLGQFYDKRDKWINAQTPVESLQNFAKQLGFTETTFKACITVQKLYDGLNETRTRGSNVFQIDGTPTFFVNGRKQVGISTKEELDKALAPFL
jgi:protein-disulfide isomerase